MAHNDKEKDIQIRSTIMRMLDDARKVRALMGIIRKMIAKYQKVHKGNLDQEMFTLFKKAEQVNYAKDHDALGIAIKNI